VRRIRFSGYLKLMREHDTGDHTFKKNEEVHRDLLWRVMLDNPSVTASAEFKVVKVRIITQRTAADMHAIAHWTRWVHRLAH